MPASRILRLPRDSVPSSPDGSPDPYAETIALAAWLPSSDLIAVTMAVAAWSSAAGWTPSVSLVDLSTGRGDLPSIPLGPKTIGRCTDALQLLGVLVREQDGQRSRYRGAVARLSVLARLRHELQRLQRVADWERKAVVEVLKGRHLPDTLQNEHLQELHRALLNAGRRVLVDDERRSAPSPGSVGTHGSPGAAHLPLGAHDSARLEGVLRFYGWDSGQMPLTASPGDPVIRQAGIGEPGMRRPPDRRCDPGGDCGPAVLAHGASSVEPRPEAPGASIEIDRQTAGVDNLTPTRVTPPSNGAAPIRGASPPPARPQPKRPARFSVDAQPLLEAIEEFFGEHLEVRDGIVQQCGDDPTPYRLYRIAIDGVYRAPHGRFVPTPGDLAAAVWAFGIWTERLIGAAIGANVVKMVEFLVARFNPKSQQFVDPACVLTAVAGYACEIVRARQKGRASLMPNVASWKGLWATDRWQRFCHSWAKCVAMGSLSPPWDREPGEPRPQEFLECLPMGPLAGVDISDVPFYLTDADEQDRDENHEEASGSPSWM